MTPLAVLLVALVAEDPTTLRGAPDDAAPAQAVLYRGDWLEVRGEVPGFLKVWDHRHERPGYVRAARVRVHRAEESQAAELRAVIRFLREAAGYESLGIGYAALYLRVASVQRGLAEWGEVLGALGTMADRLARRASGTVDAGGGGRSRPDSVVAGQLGVIESYGIVLRRFEQMGSSGLAMGAPRSGPTRMVVCYDGDAFARVMAMAAAAAVERAQAALALTRRGCLDRATSASNRRTWNESRLTILGEANPSRPAFAQLPRPVAHQLRLRRADALVEQAHNAATGGQMAAAIEAAVEALRQLALVDRGELAPEEQSFYEETAVRVAAVRELAGPSEPAGKRRAIEVEILSGRPGETCVRLWPAERKAEGQRGGPGAVPLSQRCTFGVVFASSVRVAAGGRAVTVAVAPLAGWTEQWIFRAGGASQGAVPGTNDQWRADVIPPAVGQPGDDIGYVEVAGFAPDGQQVLVVREYLVAAATGKRAGKRFEVIGPDGAVKHWSSTPQRLGAFSRWASPIWRRTTLSLR